MTRTCRYGHPWTDATTYQLRPARPYRRCAACARARNRAAFDAQHAGHSVVNTRRVGIDGHPVRRCLTCAKPRTYTRPEADTVAVLRIRQADPPEHPNVTERHTAIRQLRGALPVPAIAELVGVSERTVWRHLAEARAVA